MILELTVDFLEKIHSSLSLRDQ